MTLDSARGSETVSGAEGVGRCPAAPPARSTLHGHGGETLGSDFLSVFCTTRDN